MQQNNNMRWIPIDCTIPAIAGLLIGVACAIFADILPMFHVNWLMSHAMWIAPVVGIVATVWLYQEGIREIKALFDVDVETSSPSPEPKKRVSKHV